MQYENIELHNVGELRNIEGRNGVLLQRIPEKVRTNLRPGSQKIYQSSEGVEIRFVSNRLPAKVTLSAYGSNCKALLYFGDFQVGEYAVDERETSIEIPESRFLQSPDFNSAKYPFSHKVNRLILNNGQFHFIRIEGDAIRPPLKEEIPNLRFISYGTSITQGYYASSPMLSFVKQLAWRLGADAINLGAAASAHCEKELADYIALRADWDFATMEISANMLNQKVSAEEFRKRAGCFVNTIAEKHQGKPIICISVLPSFLDLGYKFPERMLLSTPQEYRAVLKEITETSKYKNLHYVDGSSLIDGSYGLTHDILHPGDMGMIEIAEKLSAFIRPLLKEHL